MRNYLVLEIQTDASGVTSTIIDTYEDLALAESKFHTILAAAAVSAIMIHTAVILTDNGVVKESKSYSHPVSE